MVFTMDPRDKYLKPRHDYGRKLPPLASSKNSRAATSKDVKPKPLGAIDHPTVLQTPTNEANVVANSWKFWKRRPESSRSPFKLSILSKIQKSRGTPSEVMMGSQDSRRRVETSKEARVVPIKPFCVPNHKAASANDLPSMHGTTSQFPAVRREPDPVTITNTLSNSSFLNIGYSPQMKSCHKFQVAYNTPVTLEDLRREISAEAFASHRFSSTKQPTIGDSFTEEGYVRTQPIALKGAIFESSVDHDDSQKPILPRSIPHRVDDGALRRDQHTMNDQYLYDNENQRKLSCTGSISLSYCTNDNFSPGLAPINDLSDTMLQYHLCEPETPSVSEFGGDLLDSSSQIESQMQRVQVHDEESEILYLHGIDNTSTTSLQGAAYPGFLGYSLPEPDQGSTPTLKKLPSNPFNSSDSHPRPAQDPIHSWNDGSEHRATALEALVDDLGYLGELIN